MGKQSSVKQLYQQVNP